ncbi:MAG: hypothetical protein AB1750_06145, partial [Chloroflexota bacterium]
MKNFLQRLVRAFFGLSFRAKLIIGNVGILTVSILVIGWITIQLTSRSTNYLPGQLNDSERQRAETSLGNSTQSYAHDLD